LNFVDVFFSFLFLFTHHIFSVSLPFYILQKTMTMFFFFYKYVASIEQRNGENWGLGNGTRRNLKWAPQARVACHLHANLLSSCLGLWSAALLSYVSSSNQT